MESKICFLCFRIVRDPKPGVNFKWWPSAKVGNVLCKECAKEHLTDDSFEETFGEKKYNFPITMVRKSCWEPDGFASYATAENKERLDLLRKEGYAISIKNTIKENKKEE